MVWIYNSMIYGWFAKPSEKLTETDGTTVVYTRPRVNAEIDEHLRTLPSNTVKLRRLKIKHNIEFVIPGFTRSAQCSGIST